MTIGLDCKLYRNTGVYASPTWSPIVSAQDVTVPITAEKVKKSSRVSAIHQYAAGQVDFALSFPMIRDDDATNYVAIRTALINRSSLDIAVADGAIATTGTIYVRMQVHVFKFDEKQGLNEALMSDIEMAPNDAVTHPPAFVTVS